MMYKGSNLYINKSAVAQKEVNMQQELYERVLKHVTSDCHKLSEYDGGGDIPHYMWTTWKYLPDLFGERMLQQDFDHKTCDGVFSSQLAASNAYDFLPVIVNYHGEEIICIGKEFLRYNPDEKCFIVSHYPYGYDELYRNCMKWGKFFKGNVPRSDDARVPFTMIIWYSFCEVCGMFPNAANAVINYMEETYKVLHHYVNEAIGDYMLTYDEFRNHSFMISEENYVMKHIELIGGMLYNIPGIDGNPAFRFCFDEQHVNVEWQDSRTGLSHLVTLNIPSFSGEVTNWMNAKCDFKLRLVAKYCIPGLLARCRVRLNWYEAKPWIYSYPMVRINVKSVDVKSFADVV